MAAKKLDAKALKEKKQKKIAAILLVVLLAAMAFSIPKTLKMMNQSSAAAAPPPVATTTTAATTTPAPGTEAAPPPVDAAAGAAAVAAAGAGPVTGVAAADPSEGLLVSFERFEAKDPFEQQLSRNGTAGASGTPADGSTPTDSGPASGFTPSDSSGDDAGEPALPADGTGTGGGSGSTPIGGEPAPGTPTTPTTPAAGTPTTASISVNGAAAENVAVEGTFPTSEPLFQLVEITKTGAKIAIVDGGYENGAKSIVLTVGKTLTLMNTADGTKYEIRLVSVG